METETCKTCRFWFADDSTEKIGECHCRSPRAVMIPDREHSSGGYTLWPATLPNQWCGEYQRKPLPVVDESGQSLVELFDGGLSVRAFNSLDYDGIKTIEQLVTKTARELRELRNFGAVCLSEVRCSLAAKGLSLKGDPKPFPVVESGSPTPEEVRKGK